MGLVTFLLVSIVLLLCVPVEKRASAIGWLVLSGVFLWVVKTLHLVEAFGGLTFWLLALAWQYRVRVFISLGVLFFAWFFGFLAYCFIRDQIDNYRAAHKG